jgi:anti-sigma regulatory factor (Ser/Thr protein kinase)
MVAGLAVRESVVVAGRPERARVARAFVRGVLGYGHPREYDAALLVSELFSNSVQHSRSSAAGEMVTVAVRSGDGVVRVEVIDRSGPGAPQVRSVASNVEGGRGLVLVAGWLRGGAGTGAAGGP